MTDELSYEQVTEQGEWLEDRRGGRFSRYALGVDEAGDSISVWVDHDTETLADPDDGEPEEEQEYA